jgi:hypothetical protein
MKKTIKLTESELTKLVEKMVKQINEEDDNPESLRDMRFSVEPNVRMTPREKNIGKIFGKYEEQIPNDVLRYLRKNPQLVMNRLLDIYGDKFLGFAEKAYMNQMNKDFKNDNN